MSDPNWIRIQRKTFTRWCNTFLVNRNLAIANLETDLSDGVALHNLLEILSGEKLNPKPSKQVKMKVQKVEQINRVIRFIQAKGIKIVGIGGQDVHDGNTKLILGLIWTLILRFQISINEDELGGSSKQALLDWCNKVLNPQGVEVKNFKDSWQDGRAFCGLVNALEEGAINLDERTPDKAEESLNLAFNKAEELFQFPKVLDAEDVLLEPDDLSMMCYISYFRGYLQSNTAHAPSCYAEGPGLKGGLVLKPSEFKVFVRNDQNEQATRGGAPVRCFLKDENDEDVCRVSIIDNRDGTYSCSYEAPRPGKFTLYVRIAKNEIKGSPFTAEVVSGEPFPGKCVALGPGAKNATAGQLVEFKIQAKDMNGNNLDKGGGKFTAVFKEPKGDIQIKITDHENGTYTGSYTPITAGNTELVIEVATDAFGEGPIEGSPYVIKVNPSSPTAANTVASGPGLQGVPAGDVGVITVQAKDEFDNNLDHGGAPIKGLLTSKADKSEVPVEVIDNGDGTYTLKYTPKKVGEYNLDIKLGEDNIKNAPFSFTILPGKPDPLKFEISGLELDGDGKRVVTAGVTDKYKISSRDAFGNIIKGGGLKVEGTITGVESVPVTVKDAGDGSYEISYTPTKIGDYKLEVKVDGKPIGQHNPLPLHVVAAGPSAANTKAYGDGLTSAKLEGENTFTVKAFDSFDNPITVGGSNVGGSLKHSDGSTVPITATDNKDGTYTCTYPNISKAGTYQVTPTLNGQPVQGAPFELKVSPGTVNPELTQVEFLDSTVAGLPCAKVHLKDKHFNHLFEGGDTVEAKITPLSKISGAARDNGDGTYDIIYPADFRGDFEVVVKVNDDLVPGGPWNVTVNENPVSDEMQNEVRKLVPTAAKTWIRLLSQSTESERNLIVAELASLVSGEPMRDLPVSEDAQVTVMGAPKKGFAKPKKPTRAPATGNVLDSQKALAEKAEEAHKENPPEQIAGKKVLPVGSNPMAALASAAAAKRNQVKQEKGLVDEEREGEFGKAEEKEELKPEVAPTKAAAKPIGFGMAIGDIGAARAGLKKTSSVKPAATEEKKED